MIAIQLPDGSKREFAQPVTVADVAASIGAGLAKAALGGRVGKPGHTKLVDTSYLIERDESLAIVTDKDPDGLDMIRQVANQGIGVVIITHIMQQAFQVADRIVVIRQGVVAGDVARNKTSPDAVINMITGETLAGAGPAG